MLGITLSTARGVGSIVKGYDPQVTQMQSLPFDKATYGKNQDTGALGTDTVGIKPGTILFLNAGKLAKAGMTPQIAVSHAALAADLYMAMDDSHDRTSNELGKLTVVRLTSGIIIETSEVYDTDYTNNMPIGTFLMAGADGLNTRDTNGLFGFAVVGTTPSVNIVTGGNGLVWQRRIGSVFEARTENKLYGRQTIKIACAPELIAVAHPS
jgi:hypothetical protein